MTKQEKKLEQAIDRAFKIHGNRVQIPMLKLGALFSDVRRDVIAGLDVDTAMIDAVKRYGVRDCTHGGNGMMDCTECMDPVVL